MSPERGRAAVAMLRDRLGVSERRAWQDCWSASFHAAARTDRSSPTTRRCAATARVLHYAAAVGVSPGAHASAALGWEINRKRVQRLWREEGLRVPQRTRKRRRLGAARAPKERLRAERPGHVWAFDFQFDQTADGQTLKLLNVVDEFTREALVMHADRGVTADQTVAVLEGLVAGRGAPRTCAATTGRR